MGSESREIKSLTKNQKHAQKPGDKKYVAIMKNAFKGLISRRDMTEERISELNDISVEISKIGKQREKTLEKTNKNIQPKKV